MNLRASFSAVTDRSAAPIEAIGSGTPTASRRNPERAASATVARGLEDPARAEGDEQDPGQCQHRVRDPELDEDVGRGRDVGRECAQYRLRRIEGVAERGHGEHGERALRRFRLIGPMKSRMEVSALRQSCSTRWNVR